MSAGGEGALNGTAPLRHAGQDGLNLTQLIPASPWRDLCYDWLRRLERVLLALDDVNYGRRLSSAGWKRL